MSGQRDTRTDPDRLTEPVSELVAGTKLDRYVIGRRLGAGGMGVVYAAWDTELAREVALKVVRPRTELHTMQARLRREAQAMARLSHGNVVPVFDIGTHEGQLFLAMELVAGETLRGWVTPHRPWREVVRVFARAGRGLAAAHAAGLLHRDFKPDNVMIDRDGEPRITDFGLASELAITDTTSGPREHQDGELDDLTPTGALAGTPAYMAPEQLLGARCDAQADQFSYCVSLFEVLHGTRPFRGATLTPDAWVAEIRAGRIAEVATARAIPRWLRATVHRGLAFERTRRWPSMLALVDALERGLRRRRRRINVLVAALAVVIGGGLAALLRTPDSPSPGCLEVASQGNDAVTILVCKAEYVRAQDPRIGVQLADALRRTNKLAEAESLASELLATPARADALYTLGKIAGRNDRTDDAARLLRLAAEEHRKLQRWGDAAADLQAAAQFSGDVVEQLVDLERAAADASRGGARKTEAYCHLTTAIVLSKIGARAGAMVALDSATRLMPTSLDQGGLDLERGNVHQNLGEHALAIDAFERALAHAEKATIARRALAARDNLVYSFTEAGRFDDAASHLKAARALDPEDRRLVSRLSLEAQLEARRGAPGRAAQLVDRALALSEANAPEDRLELVTQRSEIALQQGQLDNAESWARRAIAIIEQVRSTRPPVELRSWIIVDRRIPYEVLFASLAGRGDAKGALIVFDRYRGPAILAGLVFGESVPSGDPRQAFPAAELERLLPPLDLGELAIPAAEQAILEAVRPASLLAFVVARGVLWRIVADGGRLEVASLGMLAALGSQLEQFTAAPDDRALAAALGALLVPAELARRSERALHVVLDEPLALLPVAALRIGERRLVAIRPVVRAARPSAVGCAPTPPGQRRVVALDVGSATRGSLLATGPNQRLHLAVPIEPGALGDTLALREGRVPALEVAARKAAAAQIILAVPGTPIAGSASMAMAFVAAGADQVIGTVRPVGSETLAQVTDQLERARGDDLVRELARIQLASDDGELLAFAAFGRAHCDTEP